MLMREEECVSRETKSWYEDERRYRTLRDV